MPPFNLKDRLVYGVRIWSSAIHQSLAHSNEFSLSTGTIVELACGSGPLRKYVSVEWFYVGLDIEQTYLDRSAPTNLIGDVHRMPFKSDSVDVLVTVSSVQYFNHNVFFEECHRVLRAGGVVLLHENGPANPFIMLSRLIQRIMGLFFHDQWRYRNTIRRYYRPKEIPEGFSVEYKRAVGVISPLCFMADKIGIRTPDRIINRLEEIDRMLVGKFPLLERFVFLNIAHLRRR